MQPENKNFVMILILLTVFVYLSAPFVEAFRLYENLKDGNYPVEADSIGIPFYFFLTLWFLSAPLIFGFIFWLLKRIPSQIFIFGFNKIRPLWSFIWSLLFAFPIFFFFFTAVENLFQNHLVGTLQNGVLVYLALIFRAIVVFRE